MIKVILEVWVLLGHKRDGDVEVTGVYESNKEASAALMSAPPLVKQDGTMRPQYLSEEKMGPFKVGFDIKHFIAKMVDTFPVE